MASPSAGTDATESSSAKVQQPKRPRRPRGSIDVEDIINGAFELAEEVTLNGLSMPMLAKHLGVAITSIYWHFRKKAELLDAMTDRATKQYHFSMPFVEDATWQEGLRKHFLEVRQVFRDKPVLCDLILMRTGELSVDTMQDSLKNLEAAINTMVEAGFSPADALDLYMTLSLHIRGAAVLERLDTAAPTRDIPRIPSAEHTPLLHELAIQGHLALSITDTTFMFTVDAIIKEAERLLLAKGSAPEPREAASE